jgi:hypothetical protein
MRQKLPHRRASTTFSFVCGAHHYTATYSCFPGSAQIAEIFLGNNRASGSDVDAAAKDSAILASLCLQAGISVQTIQHALLKDAAGNPASPLGIALAQIGGGA